LTAAPSCRPAAGRPHLAVRGRGALVDFNGGLAGGSGTGICAGDFYGSRRADELRGGRVRDGYGKPI